LLEILSAARLVSDVGRDEKEIRHHSPNNTPSTVTDPTRNSQAFLPPSRGIGDIDISPRISTPTRLGAETELESKGGWRQKSTRVCLEIPNLGKRVKRRGTLSLQPWVLLLSTWEAGIRGQLRSYVLPILLVTFSPCFRHQNPTCRQRENCRCPSPHRLKRRGRISLVDRVFCVSAFLVGGLGVSCWCHGAVVMGEVAGSA